MDANDFNNFISELAKQKPEQVKKILEYKAYYNSDGTIITYTTEALQGDYIIISKEQFDQARPDAIVRNGKLTFTHILSHISTLTKNTSRGIQTSKYDINILDEGPDTVYWANELYEIK